MKSGQLSDGKKGNIETINLMRTNARRCARIPMVREFAIGILNSYKTKSQNYLDEAYAIADFVKNNVEYVRDPDGIELLTDPVTMIDKIQRGCARGDCDDMSLLIATLLLAVGHSPYFRAVRYETGINHYNHIYVIVIEKNLGTKPTRMALDAIVKVKPIGFEVNHLSGDDYPV